MAKPKPPLNIQKFKGTPEDVPIDKWLLLFDMKAAEASWTHRDRVSHFSEYIEGEAFKWYLTEIFGNGETTWDDIKRDMQARFATTDGDAFRLFIHYRLKGGQTIKDYYDEKKRLGSLADLKECHIISGLTDGVPPDVELALAGLSFNSSLEWLTAAQRVETSLKRVRGVSFTRNASIASRAPRLFSRPQQPTLTPRPRAPQNECRYCSAAGFPRQFHWHNECPRRGNLSAIDTERENEEGDPEFH